MKLRDEMQASSGTTVGIGRPDEVGANHAKHAKTFLTRISRIGANQRAESPKENSPGQSESASDALSQSPKKISKP
jgi:hypothetical protein